jgi:tol-pal system protein YbgF
LGLLGLSLSGCATKGDLRSVQDEIRALGDRTDEAVRELSGLNLAVQDTLGRQSDAIFESRGDINRRLQLLEQEILTIQELLRLNQQSLMTIRDLLETQRSGGFTQSRTDTDPGRDLGFSPTEQVAGGPVEMYNTAATQFNNGSLSTARRAFQQFLREYPTDALAPNAHFYLAEILFQEERLDEAISGFLRVPELFPAAEMVPDAHLRLGEIYIRQDKLDDARYHLLLVVNSYPDTEAARQAQERLDEIG